MKKAITLVLALALGVSLAACGGGGGTSNGGDSSAAPSGSGNSAAEGATYNWTAANVLAADQPWDLGLKEFGRLLSEYSGGRMTLTVQSGGVLGQEIETLESVQMGTLDFAICSTSSVRFRGQPELLRPALPVPLHRERLGRHGRLAGR